MRFSLRQLQVFAEIAHAGTVSKAADSLTMSQSAASTALIELEKGFGRPLFDRVGKRLQLNETGRLLLPRAVELLDRAEEIDAIVAGHQGMGLIRIGASLTIGNYLGTLLVAEFSRRHAESRPQLTVANSAHILAALAGFDLDLGLVEGECTDPELAVSDWIDDELAVFCAPTHELAGQTADRERLLAEDWILREPGSGTRQCLDQALGHDVSRLKIRFALEHTEGIKRAVEAGLGIGCASRLSLREAFRRGSLAEIRVPGLDLRRRFHFVQHRRKYQTPAMTAFFALCREVCAGARRSDEIQL